MQETEYLCLSMFYPPVLVGTLKLVSRKKTKYLEKKKKSETQLRMREGTK